MSNLCFYFNKLPINVCLPSYSMDIAEISCKNKKIKYISKQYFSSYSELTTTQLIHYLLKITLEHFITVTGTVSV